MKERPWERVSTVHLLTAVWPLKKQLLFETPNCFFYANPYLETFKNGGESLRLRLSGGSRDARFQGEVVQYDTGSVL